jgi:hypothetical protein
MNRRGAAACLARGRLSFLYFASLRTGTSDSSCGPFGDGRAHRRIVIVMVECPSHSWTWRGGFPR